mgnify:CR=1 FL=1
MKGRRQPMTRARAEEIAVAALGFLAADPERLGAFLGAAGLSAGEVRAAAGSPGFLAGIMDHVASDEALLLALARDLPAPPETVIEAWQLLSHPPALS